jgi:hypothetical protein
VSDEEVGETLVYAYCHPALNGSITLTIINPSINPAAVVLTDHQGVSLATTRNAWVFTAPVSIASLPDVCSFWCVLCEGSYWISRLSPVRCW